MQENETGKCVQHLPIPKSNIEVTSMPDLNVSWQKILHDAIRTPGTISEAYSRFHSYVLDPSHPRQASSSQNHCHHASLPASLKRFLPTKLESYPDYADD